MTPRPSTDPTRRDFLVDTGRIAAASALAQVAIPGVHIRNDDTIRVALIGCGGRGGGAAVNALSVPNGNLKMVALADVFEGKPQKLAESLRTQFKDQVDLPAERLFIGFDGYRKAMDCLSPGDIVILTTPPAFRWVHFTYAIEKGLNIFMEKPVAVDGPTAKRMLTLNEAARKKGLRIGVGLMSRHNHGMQELQKRIAGGEIGEILFMRGYRMHGPEAFFRSLPKPEGISELMYQIQRFHSFLWASGGNFCDFNIHIIDHLCWMKNAWPVKAQGVGGRHYRESPEGPYVDQNFDAYGIEYTFDDGSKLFFDGRCMTGCKEIYQSFAHGTKGMAVVSSRGDCGLPSGTFKSHKGGRADLVWQSDVPKDEQNPYQNEWNVLVSRIRKGEPHNEVDSGVQTSLVTAMGRMAAHTGQEIKVEDMLNGDYEFAPDVDKLTFDSPSPLQAGPDGRYPVPMPGQKQMREY
ncbi:MAG: Gfo/Idh/MocA family oxidoreductase [Planctomycetota bacterium]